MPTFSDKLQTLVNAGVIKTSDLTKLTDEFKNRIESLSDAEITHLISIKAKLGSDHIGANSAFIDV